jgi:hypothetical protein
MERARALPVCGQGFSHLEQHFGAPDNTSLFPAGQGWLHMFFATRWHDPVTHQIHDLIES